MLKLEGERTYKIVLVGCGATGSQLLPFFTQLLAYYPNNKLKLIDGDLIEEKNLRNQKFLPEDVNRSKAEVLCERYQDIYPNMQIDCVDQYIKSKEQLIEYLKCDYKHETPILVGCVDNNASRKIFHEVFYDDRVPDLIYIDSGNGTTERIGQIIVGYKKGETKQVPDENGSYDYLCMGRLFKKIVTKPVADIFPAILEDKDDINKVLSCSYVSNEAPQQIATNITAAVTLFNILNNIIVFNELTSYISYFSAAKPELISRGIDIQEEDIK